MAEIDATGRTTREVNEELRRAIAEGATGVTILNPGARHNLAVAVLQPVRIRIAGSAGYYCSGLIDGAAVEVEGSAATNLSWVCTLARWRPPPVFAPRIQPAARSTQAAGANLIPAHSQG